MSLRVKINMNVVVFFKKSIDCKLEKLIFII